MSEWWIVDKQYLGNVTKMKEMLIRYYQKYTLKFETIRKSIDGLINTSNIDIYL